MAGYIVNNAVPAPLATIFTNMGAMKGSGYYIACHTYGEACLAAATMACAAPKQPAANYTILCIY